MAGFQSFKNDNWEDEITSHESGADYIYLYLSHAKNRIANLNVNGFTKLPLRFEDFNFNKNSDFIKAATKNANSAIRDLKNYAKKFNMNPEEKLKQAVEFGSFGKGLQGPGIGVNQLSPVQYYQIGDGWKAGLPSRINRFRKDAGYFKQAILSLNGVLTTMEKLDENFQSNIIGLAIQYPEIQRALGITIADGIWSVDSQTLNLGSIQDTEVQKLKDQIQEVLGTLDKIDIQQAGSYPIKDEEQSTVYGYLLLAIQRCVYVNRGFLAETELMQGFLQAIVEGNGEFEYGIAKTGTVSKEMRIREDKNIKEDKKIANEGVQAIQSILASMETSSPKSDLMISVSKNGAVSVFGVSVKAVSNTKFNAISSGKGAKKYSIGMHSTGQTLDDIMTKYNDVLRTVIGQDPKWYTNQLLTGIGSLDDEHPYYVALREGLPLQANGTITRTWNQIVNLCAILAVADGLVSIGDKTIENGAASYLVVNQSIFRMSDVLQNIVRALRQGINPGVYGLTDTNGITINSRWGLELQQKSFVDIPWGGYGDNPKQTIRAAALQRSLNVRNEWDAALKRNIIKLNISLGALTRIGKRSGLAPIN